MIEYYGIFEAALRAWRRDGGAMEYLPPDSASAPAWAVGDPGDIAEASGLSARQCTANALAAGGMTARGIARAMAGWRD